MSRPIYHSFKIAAFILMLASTCLLSQETSSPEEIYQNYCADCHGADGLGLPKLGPPLVDAAWVTGPPEVPVRILLDGFQGSFSINGLNYEALTPMEGYRGDPELTDTVIADIVSYIRGAWGNGKTGVSSDFVAEVRKGTAQRNSAWTAEELEVAFPRISDPFYKGPDLLVIPQLGEAENSGSLLVGCLVGGCITFSLMVVLFSKIKESC